MGYGDISPFGNEVLRTPNLQSMAEQGRTFTNFYASPVCTMSRASLLTGNYNVRISMPSVIQPPHDFGLNPAETNIANLLKQKGYATACIGKWHLGHQPEFLPHNQGFDTYFGIPYSNNMTDDYMKGNAPPLPLYENDTVAETEPDQSQFTKRFTERAISFITEHKDEPFFVYLPHPMIHTPLFASEDFKGKSKMGILGDAIEEIDWSVGQINQALETLGLAENTLVIFTSDNGPAHHPAGSLRGVKGSTHEGGVRVPTVMRWPGKVPAGTTCRQIAGTIDILPTIAHIVNASLDSDRPIDGADISSLLFESEPNRVRDTQLYYGWSQTGHLDAIRQGKWKLFLGSTGQAPKRYDYRPDNYKTRPVGEFETALYDLEADPSETTDVSEQHPKIAARLKAEAERRDTEIKENARPIGTLASSPQASSTVAVSETDASRNFRYAYSADGFNQDRDDVAGSAMAVALFDKAGFSDRIVHFHFNTNFGGKPTHAGEHRKSVLQTAVLFGMIEAEDAEDGFFDAAQQREVAIVHLAKQMRRSSQAEPLMMICAGGVQVPYAALKLAIEQEASEQALRSITFLSHGKANELTRRAKSANDPYRFNWHDLKKISPQSNYIGYTSPLVNGIRTGGVMHSQNSAAWNQSPRSQREGVKPWLWLSQYGERVEGFGFSGTKGEWLLTRLKAAGAPEIGHNGNAEGDASDAGMVFAVLPGGLTDPKMNEIKEFFMSNETQSK